MRRIFGWAAKSSRLIINCIGLKNYYWADLLTKNFLSYERGFRVQHDGMLSLEKFEISIRKNELEFLFKNYQRAIDLVEIAHVVFSKDQGNELIVTTKDFRARLRNEEEIFILHEILVGGIYNFRYSSPLVVWDIGMNVGFSALYFAAMPDVEVVGYEPIEETYLTALQNFRLNPHLAGRISPIHAGIGGENKGSQAAFYHSSLPGSSGLFPAPGADARDRAVEFQEIRLKNATEALDDIMERFPRRNVILKMDCEGAEYQIIRALSMADRLRELTAIMMEWHVRSEDHDPLEIVRLLEEAGFMLFFFTPSSKIDGRLYAVNSAD